MAVLPLQINTNTQQPTYELKQELKGHAQAVNKKWPFPV